MIPALIAVGILGLFAGVYLGMAGMALLTANRHALMRDSRDMWRRRAFRAEQWLPVEVVVDILAQETAS